MIQPFHLHEIVFCQFHIMLHSLWIRGRQRRTNICLFFLVTLCNLLFNPENPAFCSACVFFVDIRMLIFQFLHIFFSNLGAYRRIISNPVTETPILDHCLTPLSKKLDKRYAQCTLFRFNLLFFSFPIGIFSSDNLRYFSKLRDSKLDMLISGIDLSA